MRLTLKKIFILPLAFALFFKPVSTYPKQSDKNNDGSANTSSISKKMAESKWDNLYELTKLPKDTYLFDNQKRFIYRGKIGHYELPPSKSNALYDDSVNYASAENKQKHLSPEEFFNYQTVNKYLWNDNKSIKIMYNRKEAGRTFCGAYLAIAGDISGYSTMTFMIKGKEGGESFEIGMCDNLSDITEAGVFIGAVNRFLPKGKVTTEWQTATIPLSEFYNVQLKKTMTLIFDFVFESKGCLWIDDIRFYKESLSPSVFSGDLLIDNFDYSYTNCMGNKTNSFKKLPSYCKFYLDKKVFYGQSGWSLKLDYNKDSSGWCGYFTMLNKIGGKWSDLSNYDRVSFVVKGKKGGESFEIGLSDKNWQNIGDSLKVDISKYLKGGVTKDWQEVTIPIKEIGALDLTEMGSLVINFNKKQKSSIWIDNLKLLEKSEFDQEPDW